MAIATLPPLPPVKGHRRTATNEATGEQFHFWVLDRVHRAQSDLPSKVLCIERIRHEDGQVQLRIGYYRYNAERRKWIWAQNSPMAYADDFQSLFDDAQTKGWFAANQAS